MAPLMTALNMINEPDSGDSSHCVNDGVGECDNTTNNNKTGSVRFVSFLQHRIIPPSRDYSEEEVQAAWYSRGELAVMKKERYDTVRLLNTVGSFPIDSEQHCSDGLLTDDESCLRRTTISDVLESVLSEQEVQIEEDGRIDHDMIADVYFEACCVSESQALERGMRVAREVKSINVNDTTESTDTVRAPLPYTSPKVAQSKSFGRTRSRHKRNSNPSKARSLPKTYMNQTRPKIYQPPRITHTIHDI